MSSFSEKIKVFLLVLVVFLVIDLPVILIANKKMYADQFAKINNNDAPSGYTTYINAILSYLFLALGIYYFGVSSNSYMGGLVFGLCVYGVYNATNLATIKNFDLKLAGIDTAWGTFLCLIVTIIASFIAKRFILSTGSFAEIETTTDVDASE